MIRRPLLQSIVALAVGVIFLGVYWTANTLAAPDWVLVPLQLLARAVHLLTIPLRLIINYFGHGPLRPFHATHWAGFVFTPLLYWALAEMALQLLRVLSRHIARIWWALRPEGARPEPKDVAQEVSAPVAATTGISRRQMLARAGLLGAGTVGISASGYATYYEPDALKLREYTLPIADLPPSLDGLRIVQFADSHYGPYITLRYLRYALDLANSLAPDVLVLNGDYVQVGAAIEPGITLFERAQARLGIAAVLGNHDHWEGAERCRAAFKSVGIPLIDNTRVFLTANGFRNALPAGEALCLGGVGDLWCDEVLPEVAFREVPAAMPRILVSHNPDMAEVLPKDLRIDLMLSGHTHGGQVRLPVLGAPFVPSQYGKRYLGGLCQGPQCPVLVSRGIGMAGFPVRLGVPPELCHITLRSKTA